MSGETDQVQWRGVQPVSGIRGVWPAIDSVRLYVEGINAAYGNVDFGTVAANKIAFISNGIISSTYVGAPPGDAQVAVWSDVPAIRYRILIQRYKSAGQMTNTLTFFPAIEMNAGDFLRLRNTVADMSSWVILFGWTEDA